MSEILKNADMTIKMLILFQKFSLQSKLDKVKLREVPDLVWLVDYYGKDAGMTD